MRPRPLPSPPCTGRTGRAQAGFTLIEAVMVIVLTGIVATVVGQSIVTPVQSYLALAARARLADTADSALRRIGRELRTALPNSVRISPDGQSLELIPTTAGARYRTQGVGALQDGVLTTSFSLMGPGLSLASANQQLVFYNLGVPGADAYAPNTTLAQQAVSNRRQSLNAAGVLSSLNLVSLAPLPLGSITPPYRVFAVLEPVSFHCNTSTGLLTRHSGYGFVASQPHPPAGSVAVLADGLSACHFSLDTSLQGNGLVQLRLSLSSTGALAGAETVTLTHAVHVDNLP